MSDFRIVFDEDGYPRELRTEAERARAIARGALTRDTDVVVYRDGEPAYACKAGAIRSLWADEPPEPDRRIPLRPEPPARHDPPPPEPPPMRPAAMSPPPERIPQAPRPSLWSSLSLPAPAPPARKAVQAPRPSPPPPAPAPAARKGGCVTTLFWLFLIFILLRTFT